MKEKEHKIILKVEGITCSGCAMDIENILLNTDGILETTVNFAKNTISVSYDTDDISELQLLEKVGKLGLKAKKI